MSTYKRDPITGDLIPIANKSVIMTGATSSANGTAGNVPAPIAGQENATLFGDGTWNTILFDSINRYEDPTTGKLPMMLTGNLDVINTSGRYMVSPDVVNIPISGFWGIVTTYLDKNGNGTQIYNTLSDNENLQYECARGVIDGKWSDWRGIDTGPDLLAPDWEPNTSYGVNWVRRYKNKLYICKLAHTSSDSLTPTNTTYWTQRHIGGMIYDMKTTFQAGVDTLYNACVNKGVTPSSSTPSAIASAIGSMSKYKHNSVSGIEFVDVYHGSSGGSWTKEWTNQPVGSIVVVASAATKGSASGDGKWLQYNNGYTKIWDQIGGEGTAMSIWVGIFVATSSTNAIKYTQNGSEKKAYVLRINP